MLLNWIRSKVPKPNFLFFPLFNIWLIRYPVIFFWYRNILSTFWVVKMRLTRRAPYSSCACVWTRFCGLSVPSCRTCRRSCTRECRSRTRRSASVWPATQTQQRWGHPQIIISHVICLSYKVLNQTQCGKGFFSYLRNILGFIQDLNGYQ